MAEGAFIDKLASTIAIDKVIDLLGSAGEWLRVTKSHAVPERPMARAAATPEVCRELDDADRRHPRPPRC